MPIDLSGFVTPENKFEGLEKLGDVAQENKVYNQKQALLAAAQAKSDAEDAAKLQVASNTALNSVLNPDHYKSNNPQWQNHIDDKLKNTHAKGQALIAAKTPSPLISVLLANDINNITTQKNNLNTVYATADKLKDKYKGKSGIDADQVYKKYVDSKILDSKGLYKTDFSDMTFDPNDEVNILASGNVFNPSAFDDFLGDGKSTNSVSVLDQVGKNKSKVNLRTSAPPSFIPEKDASGKWTMIPKYETVTNTEGIPLMHKAINDGKEANKEIRMVDEETFKQLPDNAHNYLEQQTRNFATELGHEPTPTQRIQFQKALAYNLLANSSKRKVSVELATANVSGQQGTAPSQTVIDRNADAQSLYQAMDAAPRDTDGNIDITPYLNQITLYNTRKANQGFTINFNPATKKVQIIDTADKTSKPITEDFNTFLNKLKTSNTKEDRTYISTLGKYNNPGTKGTKTAPNNAGTKKKLWEK